MELIYDEIVHLEFHADISYYLILINLNNSDRVLFIAIVEIKLLFAIPLESTVADRFL